MVGKRCSAVWVQEAWTNGAAFDRSNVIFLQLEPEGWVRFFFDGETFFWSRREPTPAPEASPVSFRITSWVNAGECVGRTIKSGLFDAPAAGARTLDLFLDSNLILRLCNEADRNRLELIPAAT